jgi:hypothetical protein
LNRCGRIVATRPAGSHRKGFEILAGPDPGEAELVWIRLKQNMGGARACAAFACRSALGCWEKSRISNDMRA